MQPSNATAILLSARELTSPIRVTGAIGSLKAHLIAKFTTVSGHSPVIVLCPNDESAAELGSDLECLSEASEGQPLTVLHLPTWEQSPYSSIALSLKTRIARMSVLSSLTKKQPPHLIVTSIPASCQATLPDNIFLDHTMTLEVEGTVQSREAVIQRMLECGYLRVDPVEDPRTCARPTLPRI